MRHAKGVLPVLLARLALAAGLAAGADLDEVKKRGELRVVAMVDEPKDEFFTDRPGVGLDRELLEAFASLQKVELVVVPAPSWDRLVPMVQEGRADVLAGRVTASEARRRLVDFTAEVFPTRTVVVTRKPHRLVASVEELRRERVGTVKGTSLANAVAAAGVPPANVDDSIPSGGLPEALKRGRVTAVVLGIEHAIAERRKDPALQVGVFLGPPGSLAWAVRKGDRALLAALDEYVASVRRTPTWSRLVVKYFGDEAPEILRRAREEAER
jgi:ABC-type amino acid transport substrate-binding protein